MKADETMVVYIDGIATNVPYELDVLPNGRMYKMPDIDTSKLIDVTTISSPTTEYISSPRLIKVA